MKTLAMNLRASKCRMKSETTINYMEKLYEDALNWLYDMGFVGDLNYFDNREFFKALMETSKSDFQLLVDVSTGEVGADKRMLEYAYVLAKNPEFKEAISKYIVIVDYNCYKAHIGSNIAPMVIVGNYISDKARVPLNNVVWRSFFPWSYELDINPILYEEFGVDHITSNNSYEELFVDLILSKRINLDGENGTIAKERIDKYYSDFEEKRNTKCVCEPFYNTIFSKAYPKIQAEVDKVKELGYKPVFMSTTKIYFDKMEG